MRTQTFKFHLIHNVVIRGLVILSLACIGPAPRVARALDAVVGTGSAASCTEAALDDALGLVMISGGGTITFNCGGAATISLTAEKVVAANGLIILDGAGQITLNANNATRHFLVQAPTQLVLRGLTVQQGRGADSGPGAVWVKAGSVLSVRNTNFNSNYAEFPGSGGAIAGEANSDIFVAESTFSGNSTNGIGGAIRSSGFLDITDSRFEYNGAWQAGAVAFLHVGSVRRAHFESNNTVPSSLATASGGAIWMNGTSVAIHASTFLSNVAEFGGGISVYTGEMTIDDSVFGYNRATLDTPGCTYCRGGGGLAIRKGVVTIRNTLFEHNRAEHSSGMNRSLDGAGGAIYSANAHLRVMSSTLQFNDAQGYGGAIFASGVKSGSPPFDGSLDLSDTWIYSNTGYDGAGLHLERTGYRHGGLQRNLFESNNAGNFGKGGAIYESTNGSINMSYLSFVSNTSRLGGAVYSEQIISSLHLFNSLFSYNVAEQGGAIYYYSGASSSGLVSTMSHVTFANNGASLGGSAFLAAGYVDIRASNTVFGISPQGGNCQIGSSTSFTATNSLSADATCGAAQVNANPALGPLIADGPLVGSVGHQRRMLVHVPQAGSPLLDMAPTCGSIEDQRGRPRPQDGDGNGNASCDIGAIERQPGEGAPVRTPRARLPLIVR